MLNLIHAVSGRPWAVRAELAAHVRGLVAKEGITGLRHLAELKRTVHAFDEDDDDRPRGARGGRSSRPVGSVAIIPVFGVLTQREEVIDSAYTRSTDEIAAEVQAAAEDPKVDAVVMEVASPGGEVYGVPEAWAAIRDAEKRKPIVAHANSQMASAALYLGSAASEIWVTPSGEIGSVGVYALHVNVAKALEDMGEQWEFVAADDSPFKVEGNPTEPLSEDGRATVKRMVNRYMTMFVRDLARGRGVSMEHVRENFGKGRMLSPTEAVSAKMADQIGTLESAIRRAAQLGRERREGAAAPRAELHDLEPVAADPPEPVAPPPPSGPTPEQLAALERLRLL